MPEEPVEIYYRYTDWRSSERHYITCEEINVVGKTPKGKWVYHFGEKKFILDGKGKRFAYPTKEEALEGYILKKRRAVQFAKSRLDSQERYLALAEIEKGAPPPSDEPTIEIKCPPVPLPIWARPEQINP